MGFRAEPDPNAQKDREEEPNHGVKRLDIVNLRETKEVRRVGDESSTNHEMKQRQLFTSSPVHHLLRHDSE